MKKKNTILVIFPDHVSFGPIVTARPLSKNGKLVYVETTKDGKKVFRYESIC